MGGVDLADKLRGNYRIDKGLRNRKWWWSILFWYISVMITNTYVVCDSLKWVTMEKNCFNVDTGMVETLRFLRINTIHEYNNTMVTRQLMHYVMKASRIKFTCAMILHPRSILNKACRLSIQESWNYLML